MPQDNCQKIKLLKLYELLQQETDEEHPLTTMQLIQRLDQIGISCERRTLSKDMAILNTYGYEVMSRQVGREKGYYVEDRSFSLPELRILIDAVQASTFITQKKTVRLVDKIAHLGGSHRADILKRDMLCFNTRKHSNESIYYNVDFLEDAIRQKKKVRFRYFDLDENIEKIYRREGGFYTVEPIALVFNEDNYYLMVYSVHYDSTGSYRVDRMDSVELVDEPVTEKALHLRETACCYAEQAIKMYGGNPVKVTLRFEAKLTGSVYDRFGEGTAITRVDENTCEAVFMVQLSPTFFGWLFQFGKKMQIVSPERLKEEYRHKAEEVAKMVQPDKKIGNS